MDLFGSVRDAWIADDLHGWLDANGIYPGLPDNLAAAQKQAELYIVTTKQVSTATFSQMHLVPGNICMENDLKSCKQIYIGTQMLAGVCQEQPTRCLWCSLWSLCFVCVLRTSQVAQTLPLLGNCRANFAVARRSLCKRIASSVAQASGQLECVLQARFTEALMKDKAKVDFSADRIFSTAETGQPKSEVLKQLEQKHPGTTYHFVEDKLGTLDKVSSTVYAVIPPCSFNLKPDVPPSSLTTDCMTVDANVIANAPGV